MSKLIAAGCSYTKWFWPTWADYIGGNLYDSYMNLGAGGAGNRFIFNQISWALEYGKITKDDTVIISWSGIPREDRILPGNHGWTHTGNINFQNIYPLEGVKKYFNILSTAQELMSYITTLNFALKQIGCEVIMTCMFPWHIEDFIGEPATPSTVLKDFKLFKNLGYDKMLKNYYNKYLIPGSIEEYKWKIDDTPNWVIYEPDKGTHKDNHPSSWVHYKFALDVLSPLIKNNSKPKSSLLSSELITNSKEWTDFYKSEEKVSQLKVLEDNSISKPPLKWMVKDTHPEIFDTLEFQSILPPNLL